MDVQFFLQLCEQGERETLDFKRRYNFQTKEKRLELVKDLTAMANTPREESAYIIVGVDKSPDGSTSLLGIESPIDDAEVQGWLAEYVNPVPHLLVHTLHHEGKLFQLYELPPERRGPCIPLKNSEKALRAGNVYFRLGSRNHVAQSEDIRRIIAWIDSGTGTSTSTTEAETAWDKFSRSVHDFESNRTYLLVAAPIDSTEFDDPAALGRIPWTAVIDLDPETERTGLLAAAREELEAHRRVHLVAGPDRPTINLTTATYWVFAAGMQGRADSPPVTTHREWLRKYKMSLSDQLKHLASAVTPSPVTCVLLRAATDHDKYLRSVVEIMDSVFGEAVDFIAVTQDPAGVAELEGLLDVPCVSMPSAHLASGLRWLVTREADQTAGASDLPSSSGTPIQPLKERVLWLQEELDIVHLGVGTQPPEGRGAGHQFLRGAEIDWYELSLHDDIDRDKSDRLKRQVQNGLQSRRTIRINLYHAPGAGGTTVARRILWELHTQFPCLVLHRCTPEETLDRLFHVASITGQSILLLVDGALITEKVADQLFELLASRQVPVVILQVLRRFKAQKERENSTYLPDVLSPVEAQRFVDRYSQNRPEKRRPLERLLRQDNQESRTAFYIGLLTYEQEFLGLQPYVGARIAELTLAQRKALVFLALAHHYAQRGLPPQAFSELFGLPKNRRVDLDRALGEKATQLLVRTGERDWRTLHDAVAVELLVQLLTPPGQDRRIWLQSLSETAIEFASFCRGETPMPSEELLETVQRTFIFRDNSELLGTERSASRRFAQLVEDIPNRDGALHVLREVAATYPSEPHILAHLARYYALQMQDFSKGQYHIERAITLRPQDPVLHHMSGMITRYELYHNLDRSAPLEDIVKLGERACEQFLRAREYAPGGEHALVSEAQMRLRILDYAGKKTGRGILEYIASPRALQFVRESLGEIEDLLAELRRIRGGAGASEYEEQCRAQLDQLYGKHELALQRMDELLQRSDIYKPPIRRQIVWAYLARRGRSWGNLRSRETERVVNLLEDNLRQESNNPRDLRLWIQGVRRIRHSPTPNEVIERVAYWKMNSDDLDAAYYLYVLYALEAFDGSSITRDDYLQYLQESQRRARFRPDRTRSFEWLGEGAGIKRLIHQSELGDWDPTTQFWTGRNNLRRIEGRILRITAPQAGSIEISGGLECFFVPARSNHARGFSENRRVTAFIGFSYEGLRAWDVEDLSS